MGHAPRRWLFVGAGNMAASIVGGLIAAGRAPTDFLLIDPDARTRERVQARFATPVADGIASALGDRSDIDTSAPHGVVLAVKPPIVATACAALAAAGLSHDAPVVSIAAGVRIAAIESALGREAPVIRCMPNTPALIGHGASALFANDRCDDGVTRDARELFAAVGEVVDVTRESLIDAVTALSGSGPAYVFQLVEHLIAGGKALGLDESVATPLAIRTVAGAAAMMVQGDEPPRRLRERVTSPGGTTQAALERFANDGFDRLVLDAMRAAHDRARELGDELAN